ncbi:MAG TPA: oligosaccharide flippase family protein [Candidatus Sulfotelmatobacter sp.]|jgi:O-antigen/teichoic acid export membrane protein|nr:oligosaccharide flippase family protein [Candidatus Sulfotelmatobacter sp.]
MRKIEKNQIIKNVGSSWFSLGVNILVGIFLSPFILHHLGDTAFGIWVLIFSVTGYYGIFDFGIRSSIIRYVSKYTATHDVNEVTGLINTAMFTYTCVGTLSLLLTLVGCIYLDRVFPVEPSFQSTARWLLFVVGASVSLGFPLGVFGGMLEGLQQFYILNWTNIASSLLRVVLIVFYLHRGAGLLAVALITVGLPLLASFARAVVAMRALPVKFSWKYVERGSFRHMANYSGITFMIIVASRLRFKTDALVIGKFLGAAAITYFYAGSRLVDYASEVVSSLAQIFVPMSSQSDAAGNIDRLRKIFVAGNRACAFTTLPISAVFIILGKSIIEVWLGKKYVALGYPVLLILTVPYTLMLVQSASGRILFGMARHGKLAVVTLIEGAANLILSILLVRPFGIMGDAIGTAIPLAGTFLLFMPFHLCSRLGIRMTVYLRQAYMLPLMMCAPMVIVLMLMQRWFVAHTYFQLSVQLLAGGLAYAACVGWAYVTDKAFHVGDLAPATEELPKIPPAYQEEV